MMDVGRAAEKIETGTAAVIVVDMGGTKLAGGIANASGQLSARRTVPTWPTDGPGGLEALVGMIEALRHAARRDGMQTRGVGISVAGIVRHDAGVVHLAPNLRWHDFPLRAVLEERLGLPVTVGNDAKLATLGEYGVGAGGAGETLFGLWIGTGVGGGIVVDGRILHGAHDAAGEVAYLLPDRDALRRRYPALGALELALAGPGIVGRAAARLAAAPGMGSVLGDGGGQLRATDVLAAAQGGDAIASAVLEETLDYLALALANVATVLDPHRIVIGGAVGLALVPWYGAIIGRLEGRIPHVPPVFAATLGDAAPLAGAAASAWERIS